LITFCFACWLLLVLIFICCYFILIERSLEKKKMAVKEKSFSLSRFFNKSSTKLSTRVSQPSTTSCEIHTNKRTIDCHHGDGHTKTETNNNHQQLCKTRSDSELSLSKSNRRCPSRTHSLTGKSKSGKKTSTYSLPSESVQRNSLKQRRCESNADYERNVQPYAMLFESIQYADIPMLHNVMESYSNLNIDTLNEDGIAAIHFAAMAGSTRCIEPLMKYGANINLEDIRGNPPLHYAFSMQKFKFAEKLLTLGVKTDHLSIIQYPELKKRGRKTWHIS